MPMLLPRTHTSACSLMVRGLERKKKARVRWKRETEVMMVVEAIRAMVADMRRCRF